MVSLKPIHHTSLIGHTIKSTTLIHDKEWLILNLENNTEILVIISYYVSGQPMISKNREILYPLCICDVTVKDIGWESYTGVTISNLFILSTNGDMYRFNCLSSDIGGFYINIYDYTRYKMDIYERDQKIAKNKLKTGIKSILGPKEHYTKI